MATSLGNPSNARWTSLPGTFTVSLEAGNNATAKSLSMPFRCVLTQVTGQKIGAGGAGDVIDVTRNGTAVCQVDCNKSDKEVVAPASIDSAQTTFEEGHILTITPTDATNPAAILYFTFVRPAP
jgi:hypothetical protein